MTLEEIHRNFGAELKPGLVDQLINNPSAHYIQILLLRELQSSAIFTTNGQDADITTVGIHADDDLVDYSPVMMFKRKQTGSDRRKGKELQRNLIGIEDTMAVNEMNQVSPESILYGSAAGEEAISVTSRVMYDTAYSIRDSSVLVEEKFQNAPGDSYAKRTDDKRASAGPREPDFIMPGTLFPCVVTLRDATFEELVFVLGVTKMNKRYGAATSRIGRMANHFLGIYYGLEEGPANLFLSQEIVRRLAAANGGETSEKLKKVIYSQVLDLEVVKVLTKQAFEDEIRALNIKPLGGSKGLVDSITADVVREALEIQKTKAADFFKLINETKEKTYVFIWDEIPGKDNEKLIDFLKKNFKIDWVTNAKIEKFDDDKTIKISTGKNSLSLKLNDKKTEVILEIDDVKTTNKLKAKKGNDGLKISENKRGGRR